MKNEEEEEEETDGTIATPMSCNTNPLISVRFNMILYNNLSHLHQLMNNDSMSQRCLEHLLSTVMLVIDQNNNRSNNGNSNSNSNTATNVDAISNSSDDIEFEYYDNDNDEEDQQQQPRLLIDVQGFVQNTSSLILKNHCADAA